MRPKVNFRLLSDETSKCRRLNTEKRKGFPTCYNRMKKISQDHALIFMWKTQPSEDLRHRKCKKLERQKRKNLILHRTK